MHQKRRILKGRPAHHFSITEVVFRRLAEPASGEQILVALSLQPIVALLRPHAGNQNRPSMARRTCVVFKHTHQTHNPKGRVGLIHLRVLDVKQMLFIPLATLCTVQFPGRSSQESLLPARGRWGSDALPRLVLLERSASFPQCKSYPCEETRLFTLWALSLSL